jgi:hypothetical protein
MRILGQYREEDANMQIKTGIFLGLLVLPAFCGASTAFAGAEETNAPLTLPRAIEVAVAAGHNILMVGTQTDIPVQYGGRYVPY